MASYQVDTYTQIPEFICNLEVRCVKPRVHINFITILPVPVEVFRGILSGIQMLTEMGADSVQL